MNTPIILGRQIFDGLGRQLSVEAAGYLTRYHYTDGQLPPTANTLADGKRVEFTYEPELNNQLLSVSAQGESPQNITYHRLGMPSSASGALGIESFGFTRSGLPDQDTWNIDGSKHHTRWFHSMNGVLQGFDDATNTRHRRSFDSHGRVKEISAGNLTTRYTYDALSRPVDIHVYDPDNERRLTTSITYDKLGREHTRVFRTDTFDGDTRIDTAMFIQTLTYSALDQITARHWTDGERQNVETFEYDLRQRLVRYTADAEGAPTDPFGNRIVEQTFTFNALNGHEQVISRFADGSADQATFTYSSSNATQLIKVTHTHSTWPGEVKLTYDACGRVISDSLGRSMEWDSQGRLIQVRHENRQCRYGYTASGHLTDRTLDGALTRGFFSADELTHERTDDGSLHFHSGEQGLFALSKVSSGTRQTMLLGTDAQGSVRIEVDSAVRTRHYGTHGAETPSDENAPFGYAGQRSEPLTDWRILGDYRPYDPVLMCFLSPDSESPFGRGGINPYAYCAGDPVNRIDPDGHSWVNYALAGAGLAVGIAATIFSLGAASGVIASLGVVGWSALTPGAAMIIGAAALDVVSLTTGAAALITELAGGDSNSANVLGWISLSTGVAAGISVGVGRASVQRAGRQARQFATSPLQGKNSTVLFERTPGTSDVVFHDDLWGTGLRGFETHGAPDGYLLNSQGWYDTAANVAKQDIAPRLANVDQRSPLVLLACEGGSSGAAQEVANALRRPVIGYHRTIYTNTPEMMKRSANFVTKEGVRTPFALQKIPHMEGLSGVQGPRYFAHGIEYELATFQGYAPM